MTVQPGGTEMQWDLNALNPEREHHAAYHEYFLVLQAPRGQELGWNHWTSLPLSEIDEVGYSILLSRTSFTMSQSASKISYSPPPRWPIVRKLERPMPAAYPFVKRDSNQSTASVSGLSRGFEASGEDCVPIARWIRGSRKSMPAYLRRP